MPKQRFVVRERDVPGYHPANHTGTTNRRLVGPDTVGSKNLEVLLGVIEKNQGALPHAHPGIEQAVYMLAGTASVEIGSGDEMEFADLVPGDTCFFPPYTMHKFTVTSDDPVRLLVMYAPPYMEDPKNVIR